MNWESPVIALLLATFVRPALLALAAVLALRLFRIQHPASQHAVWVAVLAGMLAVPLISLVAPHLELAVLPAAIGSGGEAVALQVSGRSASAGAKGRIEIHPLLLREQGRTGETGTSKAAGTLEATSRGGGDATPPTSARTRFEAFLLYTYFAGFAVVAAYPVTGWFFLRRVMQRSRALTLRPLRISDDVTVPAAVGVFRPSVILPRDWRSWTAAMRRSVLAHEFAHIRRRDVLTSTAAQFVKCVLWFNPVAWWVPRKLSQLAEMACDAAVVEQMSDPAGYSRMLLEFAKRVQAAGYRVTVPGLAMVDSSGLGKRIDRAFAAAAGGLRRLPRPTLTLATAGLPIVCLTAIVSLTHSIAAPLPAPAPMPAPPVPPVGQPAALMTAATVPPIESPVTPVSAPVSAQSAIAVQALLNEYCVACHNTRLAGGGITLDDSTAENPAADGRKWERVLRTLRVRSMPPVGMARPDRATNDSVVAWLDRALDANASPANWPVRAEALSNQAIAARLATFLWNTAPDDELRNLADRGTIKNPAVLEQQVKRMLADSKSKAFVSSFFGGWLNLPHVSSIQPSRERFPGFDETLRDAMRRETEMFVESQVQEDRSVLDLLTANYTFVNERLAAHYGVPNVTGGEFRRVTFNDGRRAGLLGQASILSLTSQEDRISPTVRGKWILRNILGQTPPDPPPSVRPIPKDEPGQTTSVRARLEAVVAPPPCRSCHLIIDQPGYALENFNAIGQWQDSEGATPVDASGAFPDGTRFNGPAEFRAALLDRREAVLNNITEKLLTYALGRLTDDGRAPKIGALQYYEMPAVRVIVREAAPANYRWSALISAVVKSAPFQSQ
jgi:mono/diheme cytochrome c family protein